MNGAAEPVSKHLPSIVDTPARGVSSLEAKKRIDAEKDIILLDVRTPGEYNTVRMPYPNVVHILLGIPRAKTVEPPGDKDVPAFCMAGARGCEAQRVLNAAGFTRVWFIEGGLAARPFEVVSGS